MVALGADFRLNRKILEEMGGRAPGKTDGGRLDRNSVIWLNESCGDNPGLEMDSLCPWQALSECVKKAAKPSWLK
jgi:hypothetical protein